MALTEEGGWALLQAESIGRSTEWRYSRLGEGMVLHERSQFLREFEAVFSRSVPDQSSCLSIEGCWGVGKSALLDAACGIAARSACLVLRGKGGELQKRAPFGVLGRFVELASSLPSGNEEIWERARAIQADLEDSTGRNVVEIGDSFYALLAALRRIGPVLLAIDDAELVDRETLVVLQYAFHRLDDQQIWLLLTSVPRFPGEGLRAVDWLLMEQNPRQFLLESLSPQSLESVISEYLGEEPDPTFTAACHAATSGNPFLMVALLTSCRRQRVRPIAEMAQGIERRSVPRITQEVLGRLALMPIAATDLLQACAIIGDVVDPSAAHRLAKIDPLAGEKAADAAAQMELLGTGRPITFSAPIIRWAVYHDIPRARRSQLHARCTEQLSEAGAEEGTIIQHLVATDATGNRVLAERLHRAGRSSLEAGDALLAVRCLQRAIAECPPVRGEGPLYLDLAHAELGLGRPSALAHFQRALELDVEDDAEVVRVAIGLMHGLAERPEFKDETLITLAGLTSRVATVDNSLQIAFELAFSLISHNPTERNSSLDRIGALLETEGAPAETEGQLAVSQAAHTFLHVQRVAAEPTFTAGTMADVLKPVMNADQWFSPDPVFEAVQVLSSYLMLCSDNFTEVDQILHTVRDRAKACGNLRVELDVARMMSLSLLWQGSLTEAEEVCRRQHELGKQLGTLTVWPVIGQVDVLFGQGRGKEALHLRDSVRPDGIEEPVNRAAAHIECGRILAASDLHREALDEFRRAGEIGQGAGIINPALLPWRADTAMALASLGQWDEAGEVADENLKLARSFEAPRTIGIGLRAMGATTRDLTERISWLTEAVDVLEPCPARLEAASAMIELGSALIAQKQMEEARGVLRRGATLASRCGARQLVEEAGTQLRATGARPRRLGSTGLGSLTPAELRVVRLAAASKTNRAIADQLFVTVKTVEGHLAKAYRKLGVSSRRHLAAEFSFTKSDDDASDGYGDLAPGLLGAAHVDLDEGGPNYGVNDVGISRGA
jgi:DNA-binding CsgD family transcriptional regulator